MGDFDKKWCKHFMRTTTAAKQNSRSFSELKKKKMLPGEKEMQGIHTPREYIIIPVKKFHRFSPLSKKKILILRKETWTRKR